MPSQELATNTITANIDHHGERYGIQGLHFCHRYEACRPWPSALPEQSARQVGLRQGAVMLACLHQRSLPTLLMDPPSVPTNRAAVVPRAKYGDDNKYFDLNVRRGSRLGSP